MADRRGFTIIEVSVVLAILSILSAIAYPSLISWTQRAEHRMEVSTLMGWLHRAKIEAIKANSFVVIEATTHGYSIFLDNGNASGLAGDWVRQPGERQFVDCCLKNGMSITSNFPDNKARFSSRPGVKPGKFIVMDKEGNRMHVIISATGRIRVQ